MKKIFKYNLNYYSVPELVTLPIDAEIVDFGIQNKSFKIWALVTPDTPVNKRVFILAMTGQEIPYEVIKTYGTKIIEESGIVIHLLELDNKTKAEDPLKDERVNNSLSQKG